MKALLLQLTAVPFQPNSWKVSCLGIKGSFTGATQDKQGLILSAHGGSLFLDEIAELPLSMQVKLLRAVQEKRSDLSVQIRKSMLISV